MATGQDLVNYMAARQSRYRYGNERPAKLYPDRGGFTDCSGIIHAAYRDVAGIAVGDMSYRQAENGRLVARGRTVREFTAVQYLLKPGDVIAMSIKDGYRGGAAINHVEMFDRVEGGIAYTWGHGGYPPMGPTRQRATASWLLGNAAFWEVRRILPDTPPKPPTTTTEKKRRKSMNTGFYYKDGNNMICAIVNTTNGFITRWSTTSGDYNNRMAAAFQTGSFVEVTKKHYNQIVRDCMAHRG